MTAHAFDERYFSGGSKSNYLDYGSVETAIDIGFMPVVARYAAVAGAGKEQPRSLDVGCAYGFYVQRLARMGWDAHGVDISEYAVDQGRARGIGSLHVAPANRLPFPAASFDFVTSIDVIEHVPSEVGPAMVAEIHRVLCPGGLAFVATPNFIDNPYWNVYLPEFVDPDVTHINYQSAESIRRLFATFSRCSIYGDTPFRDQFHAWETSRAARHRLARVPLVGTAMSHLAWKLLGRSIEYSSYLHAVAIK